jgi:hypothetical protein
MAMSFKDFLGGLGEEIDKLLKTHANDALDDHHREEFAVLVSQVEEPARSRLNDHYRRTRQELIENKFVKLIMRAVEGRPEQEKFEYLNYLALLEWDTVYVDPSGARYPSMLNRTT